MKKSILFIGMLSLGAMTFLFQNCNSKEKNNSENLLEVETDYEGETTIEDTDESTSEDFDISSDSSNIDAMLDSYEEYLEGYISYMKKIQAGDMSSIADMSGLIEKAQDLGDKMEQSKGQMTTKQLNRMTQMINKMNEAMLNMQ